MHQMYIGVTYLSTLLIYERSYKGRTMLRREVIDRKLLRVGKN